MLILKYPDADVFKLYNIYNHPRVSEIKYTEWSTKIMIPRASAHIHLTKLTMHRMYHYD